MDKPLSQAEKKIAGIIERLASENVPFRRYFLKKGTSEFPGNGFLEFVFARDGKEMENYEKVRDWFAGHENEYKITTGSTLNSEYTILVHNI